MSAQADADKRRTRQTDSEQLKDCTMNGTQNQTTTDDTDNTDKRRDPSARILSVPSVLSVVEFPRQSE
jgi:hypothetical protein